MRVKQTTKLESGWYNLRGRGVGCWRLWRLIPSCAGCATARSNSRHFSSNCCLGIRGVLANIVSFFTSYPNIVPSVSNVPSSSDPHIRKANTTTVLHTIASPSPLTQCRNWHDPTIYAGYTRSDRSPDWLHSDALPCNNPFWKLNRETPP